MSKNSKQRRRQSSRSHATLGKFWLRATECYEPDARLDLLREMAEVVIEDVGAWELEVRRRDYLRDYRGFPLSKRCFVCAERAAQQHHVILLSLGGENSYLNLVPICKSCHEDVHPWMRNAAEAEAAIEAECASLDASYRAITSPYPVVATFRATPLFTVTYPWLHNEAATGNSCGWTHDILRLLGVEIVGRKGPQKGWLTKCVGREISFETKAKVEKIAAKNKRDFLALKARMDRVDSEASPVTSPVTVPL